MFTDDKKSGYQGRNGDLGQYENRNAPHDAAIRDQIQSVQLCRQHNEKWENK